MAWHVCLIDEDASPKGDNRLSTFCGTFIGLYRIVTNGNPRPVFLSSSPVGGSRVVPNGYRIVSPRS